jgi:hypothetical protein
MTVWGGQVQHEAVGVNVFNDGYDTNTPSINVYADWYIHTFSWGFNDNQTLNVDGSTGATFNFACNTGNGEVDLYVGRTTIYGQGQSYGGGPTYRFHGWITGQYLGGQPSVDYYWALPARPANVPTNPGCSVSNVTNNSAYVTVTASDGRGAGVDQYQVAISLPGGSFSSWSQSWTGGSGTATNLQPATVYEAAAQAHNGVGWSGWTFSGQFTTGATVPAAPTAPASNTVDQTTVNITWTAPSNNGGSAITGYDVQRATDSGFTANVVTTAATTSPLALSGLTPGMTYYVRVRAKNGVGTSAWTSTINFTTLTGTPAIISPVANAALADPTISFVVSAPGVVANDRTITLEIASVSDFSTIAKTLTLNPTTKAANDQYTIDATSFYMKSGTWYARTRVKTISSGYTTPNSATLTFTEAHTPSASVINPTGGKTWAYTASTNFSFVFNDAGGSDDGMTAYQLVIENNATGLSVYDSGKTALTAAAGATVSRSVAIATSYKNTPLRWRVMVWDKGDQPSAWTGYAVFTLADVPAVTITSPPSALPVGSGSPTFAWSVTNPSGGTQAKADVAVYDSATNALVWSTTVTGTGMSVTPPVVILQNNHSYYVNVTSTDSTGLAGTATGNFSTSYAAPNSIQYAIDSSGMEDAGYVLIDWTNALPDTQFAYWKVYRRDVNGGAWTLIATIGDQNQRTYQDFLVTSGHTYVWSVTQSATRSGAVLESSVGFYRNDQDVENIESRMVDVNLHSYWIINPDDNTLSVKLPNVIKDDSTLEFESETYQIIGRGRHTDYGDELGYSGSLTVQLRGPDTPNPMRLQIEAMRRANETYYLRTPFGRLFPISLGNLGWTPLAGTGTAEMGDMTIPYQEVH